jgi:hypothetical protein
MSEYVTQLDEKIEEYRSGIEKMQRVVDESEAMLSLMLVIREALVDAEIQGVITASTMNDATEELGG